MKSSVIPTNTVPKNENQGSKMRQIHCSHKRETSQHEHYRKYEWITQQSSYSGPPVQSFRNQVSRPRGSIAQIARNSHPP